jgi:hypothetical protein
MSANFFRVPIAIVSLVDEDRIWFKSHYRIGANRSGAIPGYACRRSFHPRSTACATRFATRA